ncbi:GTPase-GDP dissociation stimulator vimar [Cylas formicarius]|uniref:GTPase-GDP dissociation stimulator vimar n=1 Tax=Cylas formicarius TaxID=197179 RepID=UPI002958D5EC|nr:GTPase-GDP dissociation stimulator vimar [Cylas formicarius]
MENVVACINSAIESRNDRELTKNLKWLLDQAGTLTLKDAGFVRTLLNYPAVQVRTAVSDVIAEYCKRSENRKLFTDREIVEKLTRFAETEGELRVASVRALANICYENEEGCGLIDDIDAIFSLLQKARDDDPFATKVCGLLVNLLHGRDGLCEAALRAGVLPAIERLLAKYKDAPPGLQNELSVVLLLSVLNALAEYTDDTEHVFSDATIASVADIFKCSDSLETCVSCLELFSALCEKDNVKRVLAERGVCDLLYNLIEKYRDKLDSDADCRSVLRMACDVIVLVLTDDACMNLLYDEGRGKTYENMLTWLDSEDPDLLSTSVLALGNFARRDTHCIEIVDRGVSKKLITLLGKYNESSSLEDVNVQHALLSTLKNLVIPKENKRRVLDEGVIEIMYPMLKLDNNMVVFKLLGTFRMLVDGQRDAASDLVSRRDFIERLVYWCYNSDHLGVRGEVPRIFSWLVKNCHSADLFPTFVSIKDSVGCIVDMIVSNHAVMQNEAYSALGLLCAGLSEPHLGRFYESLINAELESKLRFITTKYGAKWNAETIENLLGLLERLSASEKVVAQLRDSDYADVLIRLKDNPNAKNPDEIDRLVEKFKK